ncbi:secreted Ly-6/uPAR-related protein 1-like [Gastrophryne carolinensis]
MKSPINPPLLLLLLLLQSVRTETIQCYFCYQPTPVQYCLNVKTCDAGIESCKTVTQGSDTGYPFASDDVLVTRDCAQECTDSDMEALGTDQQTFCCMGSLCNTRAGGQAALAANNSSPHLRSATYGGVMVGVSLFSLLFPSWL